MKTCTKCGEAKPLNAFTKNKTRKDGLDNRCHACIKAYIESRKQTAVVERKCCTRCTLIKPAAEFGVRRASVDGLQFKCLICVAEEAAAHRAKNPENAREINKRWYDKHGKEYYVQNRDKIIVGSRKYYANHKDLCNERTAAWFAKNPDYARERHEKDKDRLKPIRAHHFKLNREDYYTRNHNKRARLKNAGTHTSTEIKELFEKQGGVCANFYCLADITPSTRHLDHKHPLSKGGSNTIENLQWLCAACNLNKFNKTEEAWDAEQARRYYASQK